MPGELGAFEITGDPLVLAKEDLLVHLLEIEGEVECTPHARILELVATAIEDEGLHHAGAEDVEFLEQDALFIARRKIIASRPVQRAVLNAPIDLIALEGFECDRRIAE